MGDKVLTERVKLSEQWKSMNEQIRTCTTDQSEKKAELEAQKEGEEKKIKEKKTEEPIKYYMDYSWFVE